MPRQPGSPPVPLTERHGSSGNQAVESEGTTVHVDGYQVASRAVTKTSVATELADSSPEPKRPATGIASADDY
jgi:hypothetical protein